MRRAERLFRLVNEMRTRGVSRAEDLAAHFEVSTRTIYRDIAHLQASGLPIEGEAGIGYLLRPGFDLPNLTFTYDQLDALAIGLSFIENAGDKDLADAAREVRAKIQVGLPQPESRALADAPYFSFRRNGLKSPYGNVLRRAIRHRIILKLRYEDVSGQISERRVHPLAVWSFTEGWIFAAWCELRVDFRTFRIDRIVHLERTEDHFADDEAQGLRAFIATKKREQAEKT